VSVREVGARDAAPLLSPVDRYCTTDETAESMARVGRCFVVSHDGRDVASYVLQRQGSECFVLAAAGSAEFDITAFMAAVLEGHAHGLSSIAFQTRRPGLIRKARKYGYRIDGRVANGVVMRKELK
jgi:hypothetical protein